MQEKQQQQQNNMNINIINPNTLSKPISMPVSQRSSFHSQYSQSMTRPQSAISHSLVLTPRLSLNLKTSKNITHKLYLQEEPGIRQDEKQKNLRKKYESLTLLSHKSWDNFYKERSDFLQRGVNDLQEIRSLIKNKQVKMPKQKPSIIQNSIDDLQVDEELIFSEKQLQKEQYEKFKKRFEKKYFDKKGNFKFKGKSQSKIKNEELQEQKLQAQQEDLLNLKRQIHDQHKIRKNQGNFKSQQGNRISLQGNENNQKGGENFKNPLTDVILEIREKNIKQMYQKLNADVKSEILEQAKQEVIRISNEMMTNVIKIQDQIQVVKDQKEVLQERFKENSEEITELKTKNKVLEERISKIQSEYDQLKSYTKEFTVFVPAYRTLMEKNHTADSILKDYDILMEKSLTLIAKINELDEFIINNNQEFQQQKDNLLKKYNLLHEKDVEREIAKNKFMDYINEQAAEYKYANIYKDQYFQLHKQILSTYIELSKNSKVYTTQASDGGPVVHIEDPVEALKFIEKMIKTQSNEGLQTYLRQIITSANQLVRKYIPDQINEKFSPERIYKLVDNLVDKLNNDNFCLKVQLQELKQKLNLQKNEERKLKISSQKKSNQEQSPRQ